jgi:hypothetical protein
MTEESLLKFRVIEDRYELNLYILFVFLGYKFGNLALQVGGVSDETVKYGFRF